MAAHESCTITYRGSSYSVPLVKGSGTTAAQLLHALQAACVPEMASLDLKIKLLVSGSKALLLNQLPPDQPCGLVPGTKAMMLASSAASMQQARPPKDLENARLPGFDHELRTAASRRGANRAPPHSSSSDVKLPAGPYTFGRFEAWQWLGLYPAPSEAIRLLHR